MWQYEKKLQYPVKIKTPNPALARIIISQLGGASCKNIYSLYYYIKQNSLPVICVNRQACFLFTVLYKSDHNVLCKYTKYTQCVI